MAKNEQLTDEQWATLKPLIAEPKRRDDGRGRPWRENREVPINIKTGLSDEGRYPDYGSSQIEYMIYGKVVAAAKFGSLDSLSNV